MVCQTLYHLFAARVAQQEKRLEMTRKDIVNLDMTYASPVSGRNSVTHQSSSYVSPTVAYTIWHAIWIRARVKGTTQSIDVVSE